MKNLVLSDDFLPFSTQRLTLRRFADSDLEVFLAYRQDPEIGRYQSWFPLAREEGQAFIREMQTGSIAKLGEWFQIAIADRFSNLLLGDIGIHFWAEQPNRVEVGFTLARQAQGHGYAREALGSLMTHLFASGGVQTILGITDSRHHRSIRLLEAVGMTLLREETVLFRGEVCREQTFVFTKSHP
ncbi:MAG: GNAT family N-acetyltransferase [Cyanobacteriota bacterium]|nr:GNAT family N-acetyltransferase [Cyanobacteriota bacterium]